MLNVENRQSNQEVNLKRESKLFVASITGIRGFFSNSLKLRILSNKNERFYFRSKDKVPRIEPASMKAQDFQVCLL